MRIWPPVLIEYIMSMRFGTDPDPDSRLRWLKQIEKNLRVGKNLFFLCKNCNGNLLSLGFYRGRPSYRKKLHPVLQNVEFLIFFLFLWVIFGRLEPDPHWECGTDQNRCGSGSERLSCLNIYLMFLLGRDRMGISKQELVSMLEEDELKDAILGKRRIFFPSFPCSTFPGWI